MGHSSLCSDALSPVLTGSLGGQAPAAWRTKACFWGSLRTRLGGLDPFYQVLDSALVSPPALPTVPVRPASISRLCLDAAEAS